MIGVALTAPMMSGKTTVANMLVEAGFIRLALADAVKDECVAMLNHAIARFAKKYPELVGNIPVVIRQDIDNHKQCFRTLLQWDGTDFWREYMEEPEHWLAIFGAETSRMPGASIVCDDVRFPNEAEYFRNLGFKIARVERPEKARMRDVRARYPDPKARKAALGHQSETEIVKVEPDIVIPNNGTLDDLRAYVTGPLLGALSA